MEEATPSLLASPPNRRLTELFSADNGSVVNGDQSSCELEASIPFSPCQKPIIVASAVRDSEQNGEDAEIVARALHPGDKCVVDSDSVCALLSEDIQVREMQKPIEFQVFVTDSEKPSEKIDTVSEDYGGRSLENELIDGASVIGDCNTVIELETVDLNKESEAKKEKNSRRRSKAAKKGSSGLKVSAGNLTGFNKTDKGTKIVYSMKEMVTLRNWNAKGQRKLWQDIYNAFSPIVRTEYDELGCFRHQNKKSGFKMNTNTVPCVLGNVCKESVDADLEIPIPVHYNCGDHCSGEEDKFSCEDYVEAEDSDDEEIQRRAFLVEGEPNFDSGPPEDGLEYLRRVRWEAAQIPKVKVAKLDKSKMKEQSVYMPEIPKIERCPEHVLPSKEWEDEFLSDFSELRLAVSRLEGCCDIGINQMAGDSEGPTLPIILKMEPVGRVNMLKREIRLFEDDAVLGKEWYLRMFGLCAAIDTPLDADTSAALRDLLRKCCKLRATKSHLDDHAIMLNMLVTISGKYFGQAEN